MEQPFPNELKHLYKEAEFIGSGGFARVYRAKHRDSRIVAVKIPINFDEAIGKSCEIVFDIAEGLKYVHKQGINNCFGGIVYYYL